MAKKQNQSALSPEVDKKIRTLLANIQKVQNVMKASPIFPELLKVSETFKQMAALQRSVISPLMADFTSRMGEIQQWYKDFEANGPYDQDMENIAKIGWYFNDMMLPRDFIEIVGYIRGNDSVNLDDFFLTHIENNIQEYRDYCTKWIEVAPELVNEAFDQHIAGNYHSSVALFLILAELVANRLLSEMEKNTYHGIFSSKDHQPRTKILFEEDIIDLDPMFASYAPLMIFHAFNNKDKNVLSRDNILHGRFLAFGNKMTSSKAISFIGFIILSLYHIKRKITEAKSLESTAIGNDI